MKTTELVFILDRSGSMAGLEDDTIGGFNSMLKKQKSGDGIEVNVTTILFDDQIDVIHDRFPISIIEPLTDKDYYVRGSTALLDATGEAIRKTENIQKHLPDEHRAGNVIFVIITDGHENASTRFSYSQIKRMIEEKKEMGWEFLFLGANIDAAAEAEKIGICRNRSVTYENDSAGVRMNYKAVGNTLFRACAMKESSAGAPLIADNWAEEIEDYRQTKQKKKKKLWGSTRN